MEDLVKEVELCSSFRSSERIVKLLAATGLGMKSRSSWVVACRSHPVASVSGISSLCGTSGPPESAGGGFGASGHYPPAHRMLSVPRSPGEEDLSAAPNCHRHRRQASVALPVPSRVSGSPYGGSVRRYISDPIPSPSGSVAIPIPSGSILDLDLDPRWSDSRRTASGGLGGVPSLSSFHNTPWRSAYLHASQQILSSVVRRLTHGSPRTSPPSLLRGRVSAAAANSDGLEDGCGPDTRDDHQSHMNTRDDWLLHLVCAQEQLPLEPHSQPVAGDNSMASYPPLSSDPPEEASLNGQPSEGLGSSRSPHSGSGAGSNGGEDGNLDIHGTSDRVSSVNTPDDNASSSWDDLISPQGHPQMEAGGSSSVVPPLTQSPQQVIALIMELVEGGNLSERIRERPLGVLEVLQVVMKKGLRMIQTHALGNC